MIEWAIALAALGAGVLALRRKPQPTTLAPSRPQPVPFPGSRPTFQDLEPDEPGLFDERPPAGAEAERPSWLDVGLSVLERITKPSAPSATPSTFPSAPSSFPAQQFDTPAPPSEKPRKPSREELEQAFISAAGSTGVDANLLRAIAGVESSYGTNLGGGGPSYGVMQILCGSGVGLDEACRVRFNLPEWPATPRRLLTDHAYNVRLGALILKDNLRQFRGDYVRAIAAYNVGPSAVPKDGPVPVTVGNEHPRDYVRKVVADWQRRGGPDLRSDPAIA